MNNPQKSWISFLTKFHSYLQANDTVKDKSPIKERKRKIFPNFSSEIVSVNQKELGIIIRKISVIFEIPESVAKTKFIDWTSTLDVDYQEAFNRILEGNHDFLKF